MDKELRQFIEDEVQKYNGIYMPINAGFLRRHLIRRLPLSRLHPNPNDEFCSRDVRPNEGIIARYVRAYKEGRLATDPKDFVPGGSFEGDSAMDPLVVQRIHPNGYMILNGHHRWAAAHRPA